MAGLIAIIPVLLAIAIGLGIGVLKGGSIDNLRQWRPASAEVAGGALVALILADVLPWTGLVVFLLDLIGVFGLLYAAWMNRRVGGMVIVAAGLFMNLAVSMANGGAPVSQKAMVSAGIATQAQLDSQKVELVGPRHVQTDQDFLTFLGDNIALPGGTIVSPGDLVLWLGLVLCTQSIVRRRQVRSGASFAPRRNPQRTPGMYQEALSTLGMGPVDNPLDASVPPGTGHPQSGMVRRLPAAMPPGMSAASIADGPNDEPTVRVIKPPTGGVPTVTPEPTAASTGEVVANPAASDQPNPAAGSPTESVDPPLAQPMAAATDRPTTVPKWAPPMDMSDEPVVRIISPADAARLGAPEAEAPSPSDGPATPPEMPRVRRRQRPMPPVSAQGADAASHPVAPTRSSTSTPTGVAGSSYGPRSDGIESVRLVPPAHRNDPPTEATDALTTRTPRPRRPAAATPPIDFDGVDDVDE